MRLFLSLTLLALASPGVAQDRPAAITNAEACLEARVDDALRASAGATDAAEFLMSYLCGAQVEAAGRFDRNTALLTAVRQGFAGQSDEGELLETADLMQGLMVDPITGELVAAPGTELEPMALFTFQSLTQSQSAFVGPPASLREFVGSLILERKR